MPPSGSPAIDARPKVGALIRARRRQLQLTLQDICAAAGISVGYLSQVERDQATPSLGTLAQIAHSLDVGMDYFIAAPSSEDRVTRAGEREKFAVDGSSVLYERIAADFAGNILSSFIMNIPPGYRSETVSHEGEEILFVLEGAITQKIDNDEIVIAVGDSVHFRGNRPHTWWNESDRPARVLWTGTLPLFRSRAERIATSGQADKSNDRSKTKTGR
ncbi:helix-turn-helix domain-containing protein [Labrys neptuniae]